MTVVYGSKQMPDSAKLVEERVLKTELFGAVCVARLATRTRLNTSFYFTTRKTSSGTNFHGAKQRDCGTILQDGHSHR